MLYKILTIGTLSMYIIIYCIFVYYEVLKSMPYKYIYN